MRCHEAVENSGEQQPRRASGSNTAPLIGPTGVFDRDRSVAGAYGTPAVTRLNSASISARVGCAVPLFITAAVPPATPMASASGGA